MTDHRPLVSVLMPVYNAERYLAAAVDSILSQTFADFEFILIDDGSTDSSLEILREYERRDARVRVISRPNTGYCVALNELLTHARGTYLARLDADDIALPARLERQVQVLDSQPDVVCVGTRWELIDEQGRRLTRIYVPTDNESIQRLCLHGQFATLHPSLTFRREAIQRVGGYDAAFEPAEDLDLLLRLGEIGRIVNVDGYLMQYRVHAGSVSSARAAEQLERVREAARRACERRGVAFEFRGSGEWRLQDTAVSRFRHTITRGWWAFNLGERRTARAYAGRAILMRPWRWAGWNLLRCAILKSVPTTPAESH